MPKRMTNTAFVSGLMRDGPHGALTEVFVIDALLFYARTVIQNGPEPYDSALLSGAAWHRTAQFVNDELGKQYKL